MATPIWQGGAKAVAQLNTVTPANVNIGNTFTVTINGKSITFTATAATVANVTAGLVALIAASTEPEFTKLTAADATTALTLTGPDTGEPFTQTSSASGGTATNTTATTTSPQGPNWWSVAANWSTGAVPVSTDTVWIDGPTPDILYGLAQSGVTLTALNITAGYTGTIGLPERNEEGYDEYLDTYLAISATTVTIGAGAGSGSGRIKLNTGTAQTTVHVLGTGAPQDSNLPALIWKGTHASNVVNVMGGSVGSAVLPAETATVATLRVGGGSTSNAPEMTAGESTTLTTINQFGGELSVLCAATTLNKVDGTTTFQGVGAVTTVKAYGGVTYYQSSGTLGTLEVGSGAEVDFTREPRAVTVSNCTVYPGATLKSGWNVSYAGTIHVKAPSLAAVTADVASTATFDFTVP